MSVNQIEKATIHPEGKILLLNGSIIDGYPIKARPTSQKCGWLEFDTSGRFLQIGNARKKSVSEPESPYVRTKNLLADHAWELYHLRDKIYSDSRIFLAPLNVGCHLAYTDASCFSTATLGVWLEWWDSLEMLRKDENGDERLIYFFCGSPLTGVNLCEGVTRSGQKENVQFVDSFTQIWHSFLQINSRYAGLQQMYEFFSFEQVLEKFKLTR